MSGSSSVEALSADSMHKGETRCDECSGLAENAELAIPWQLLSCFADMHVSLEPQIHGWHFHRLCHDGSDRLVTLAMVMHAALRGPAIDPGQSAASDLL